MIRRLRFRFGSRVRVGVIAFIALVLALAPSLRGAFAQVIDPNQHAEVVAQGVGTMPTGQVVWRVTQGVAPQASASQQSTYPLGFVYVATGTMQIGNSGTGNRVLLQDGEASFQADGAQQRRKSATTAAVPYLGIELATAAQANTASPNNTLLTTSDAFAAPSGDRDVNLVRDVLADNESGGLPGSDNPTYVYVTIGAITVTPAGGSATTLNAGQGQLFTGALQIQAGQNGGTYLAAGIGAQATSDNLGGGNGSGSGSGSGNGNGNGSGNGSGNGNGNGNGSGGGNGNGSGGGNATAIAVTPTNPVTGTGELRITVYLCPAGSNPPSGDSDDCDITTGDLNGNPVPNGVFWTYPDMATETALLNAPVQDGTTFDWPQMPNGHYDLDQDSFLQGLDYQIYYWASYHHPTGDQVSGDTGPFSVSSNNTTDVYVYLYPTLTVTPTVETTPDATPV